MLKHVQKETGNNIYCYFGNPHVWYQINEKEKSHDERSNLSANYQLDDPQSNISNKDIQSERENGNVSKLQRTFSAASSKWTQESCSKGQQGMKK